MNALKTVDFFTSLCGSLLLSLGLAATGWAGPRSEPVDEPHATVSLIAETRGLTPGQTVQLGLRQVIQPGWHTYWVNPGDSGLPTTIDWALPQGFAAAPIAWPTPKRIPYGPLVSYGYEDTVVLPIAVTAPAGLKTGGDVTLSGHANWLVCSDVCVPEEADVAITLPVVAGAAPIDPGAAGAFAAARAALPIANPFPATIAATSDKLVITVRSGDSRKLSDIRFFPLDQGVVDNEAAQTVTADKDGIAIALARADKKAATPDRLNGVLAFTDMSTGGAGTARSFAISSPVAIGAAAPAGAAPAGFTMGGFAEALILAILGGVVLNLMPCVLPVLTLKAMSLVRHAHGHARETRLQGVAYAAGVLVSFALVAGALIAIRAAGTEIGWGFQLQSPIFVTAMIYLLFAVGLSLSGVFTVGDGVANLGGGLAAREGYAGSFFTGALATLVATPCTAPFMAAAIGFAITQPWYVAFAVFEAIGVGLALPYVLLAFVPGLRRFLPKPGAWMDRFKQLLAFPVYGTAVWLAFVLASESGSIGIAAALSGLVLIAFAGWLYETVRLGEGRGRLAGLAVSALAVAGALGLLTIADDGVPAAEATTTTPGGVAWRPFSPETLAAARAAGKPVFVDFTADWCITCKVNERVALADPSVEKAFAAGGVVALRGDWTRRDAGITRILEANGRGGVPLYLAYPTGAEPVILPQILTADAVLRAMQGG